MSFDFSTPINHDALIAAEDFYTLLPAITVKPNPDYFDHLYLHWSVEAWGCLDGNYNAEVDLEHGQWVMKLTHNPLDNAVGIVDGPYAAHTFRRNSHAFGLAITGMVDATSSNFGSQGVQLHELEFLFAAAAAVCKRYNIDAAGKIGRNGLNEFAIMTHAEAAIIDGYFGERWDLARLEASAVPLSENEALATAAHIRGRIHDYKINL